jgi:hypothetical protein
MTVGMDGCASYARTCVHRCISSLSVMGPANMSSQRRPVASLSVYPVKAVHALFTCTMRPWQRTKKVHDARKSA